MKFTLSTYHTFNIDIEFFRQNFFFFSYTKKYLLTLLCLFTTTLLPYFHPVLRWESISVIHVKSNRRTPEIHTRNTSQYTIQKKYIVSKKIWRKWIKKQTNKKGVSVYKIDREINQYVYVKPQNEYHRIF